MNGSPTYVPMPDQDRPPDQIGPLSQGATRIPSVEHQDHCGLFENRGCDCEPKVVFLEVPAIEQISDQDAGFNLLPSIAIKALHGRPEG